MVYRPQDGGFRIVLGGQLNYRTRDGFVQVKDDVSLLQGLLVYRASIGGTTLGFLLHRVFDYRTRLSAAKDLCQRSPGRVAWPCRHGITDDNALKRPYYGITHAARNRDHRWSTGIKVGSGLQRNPTTSLLLFFFATFHGLSLLHSSDT